MNDDLPPCKCGAKAEIRHTGVYDVVCYACVYDVVCYACMKALTRWCFSEHEAAEEWRRMQQGDSDD